MSNRRRGLGRGLDALLGSPEELAEEAHDRGELRKIPVEQLQRGRYQPRTDFDEAAFDVVWAVEAVCHAENKRDFVDEAYRILAPGGRLILADFFAAKARFDAEEQRLMDDWLSGWSVKALAYAPEFHDALASAGFVSLAYQDATENVRPSAKELYQYSLLARAGGKLVMSGRNERQDGNVRAVYAQYPALERGLWRYGIFLARKP